MCGIAGALGPDAREARLAVEAMCERMFARGPDDCGVELFEGPGSAVALGNRRLAIIDPSSAGRQPMTDARRGTTTVFNGMIYKFRELRQRLLDEGELLESNCDTEVVLKAYGRYGAACVQDLRGMFAFSVWDSRSNELFMAREIDAAAGRSAWNEFISGGRRWLRPWVLYAIFRWAASIDAVPGGPR